MEDTGLDLDSLTVLLSNVLQQMDEATRREVASTIDENRMQEIILETLGLSRHRLNISEQERFSCIVKTLLRTIRGPYPGRT